MIKINPLNQHKNYSNHNTKITKNTLFLYGRMIIVLFVSLYTTRVVLNVLGVSDYGIYNVVAGFVSMFSFFNGAMNNTTQRFMSFERSSEDKAILNTVFITSCQIQFMIALITVFLLETFGIWYINNVMFIPIERLTATNWVFQLSVLSLMVLILQIPFSASIISHEKMDYYAVVSIVDVIFKLFIVILLPYISYDKLIFYGFFSFALSILNFVLYYVYAKRNFPEIYYNSTFDKNRFKIMISFSGWNMFGALAYTLQGQGLNVLVNSFFGPTINAARGIAFQIQGAIAGFSENIAMAFRPQLVESFAIKDFDRTENLMYSMSKYCYTMIFVLSLPIMIEIHGILNLWLDNTIPQYTIQFTYLVIINMLITCFNLPLSQTVQATGVVKYYQVVRSIIIVFTLPIAWLCLKLGADPTSVFWVTIVVSIVNQPISMVILRYNFKYSYWKYINRVIIPSILLTILAPIIPIFIHNCMNESLLRLIIVGCVSIVISIVIVYYVVLNLNERVALNKILKNKFVHRVFAK